MVNEFKIPIENKRPVETVHELKDQVPSFEEFMKDYKVNEKVSYDDLESGDIGNSKGYGPCEYYSCPYSSRFYIEITCSSDFILYEKYTDSSWSPFYGTKLKNIQQARDFLKRFQNEDEIGGYHIQEKGNVFTPIKKNTPTCRRKRREIMNKLAEYIDIHERGGMVYESKLEIKNDCSIM